MLYLLVLLLTAAVLARKSDKGDQRVTFCHCESATEGGTVCETKEDMPVSSWERGHLTHPNDCFGPCPCDTECDIDNLPPVVSCTWHPDVACVGEFITITCNPATDPDGDEIEFTLFTAGAPSPSLFENTITTSINSVKTQNYTIVASDGCAEASVSFSIRAISCNTACCDPATCSAVSGCAGVQCPCYTGPEGTIGVGLCVAGVQTCADLGNGRALGSCDGQKTPSTETCDGFDEDCSGSTDNGFALDEACNQGECKISGTTVCNLNGDGVECSSSFNKPNGVVCSTGTCQNGVCEGCVSNCTGKTCGDDGCGASCGAVDDGLVCTIDSCDINGNTVHTPVVCPDNGDICTAPVCTQQAGGCTFVPTNNGASCGNDRTCQNGICAKLPLDATCSSDATCASGFCRQNICVRNGNCASGDYCRSGIAFGTNQGCAFAQRTCDAENCCEEQTAPSPCSTGDTCTVSDFGTNHNCDFAQRTCDQWLCCV